jgi:hypothetical protein
VIGRVPDDTARAAEAYRRGLWVHTTLADSLRAAAESAPRRTVLVDNDIRLDCATLYAQASRLAAALLARMPTGSVVSFMLPNWHEAAVVYLAAALAGMVVNPILPSLRDHEVRFILEDVETAMIFVPHRFGGHDYAAMLERVTAAMSPAPEVVVLRGEAGSHTSYPALFADQPDAAELPTLDPDAVHRPSERCPAQPQFDKCADFPDPRPLGHRSRRHVLGPITDRPHRRFDLRIRMPAAVGHHRGIDGPVGSGRGRGIDERRAVHPHGRCDTVSAAAGVRRRARLHPPARLEGVHLRRRLGVAVAHPTRR